MKADKESKSAKKRQGLVLWQQDADVFVPGEIPLAKALGRTTHLGIGAHADDLEFMAYHGIEACHGHKDKWFTGVTCNDGAGSPRSGLYAGFSDKEMRLARRREQRTSALTGDYSAMLQLDYSNAEVKGKEYSFLIQDLVEILKATRPEILYTHNPADKHAVHVGVAVAVIKALRSLPTRYHPAKVFGCEGWRDLDWLSEPARARLNSGERDHLSAALMGVFDTQISGGKRYDLAVTGRRRANATFSDPHLVDKAVQITFAMDLTPLIRDSSLSIPAWVAGHINDFKADVTSKIGYFLNDSR
jgi:LmbE family N-acetylglucosaminyl deacetylase